MLVPSMPLATQPLPGKGSVTLAAHMPIMLCHTSTHTQRTLPHVHSAHGAVTPPRTSRCHTSTSTLCTPSHVHSACCTLSHLHALTSHSVTPPQCMLRCHTSTHTHCTPLHLHACTLHSITRPQCTSCSVTPPHVHVMLSHLHMHTSCSVTSPQAHVTSLLPRHLVPLLHLETLTTRQDQHRGLLLWKAKPGASWTLNPAPRWLHAFLPRTLCLSALSNFHTYIVLSPYVVPPIRCDDFESHLQFYSPGPRRPLQSLLSKH